MRDVEDRLSRWASTASSEDLRFGPTAEDLGGATALAESSTWLATSPFLPYLVHITGHQLTGSPDAPATQALLNAVLTGLTEQPRHSAFASATDALSRRPELARALGRSLPTRLLNRFSVGRSEQADASTALIAAEAAECLLALTLTGVCRPTPLMAALDEAAHDIHLMPAPLAARLPRVIGVLDELHPGLGMRDALNRLLSLDHAHADAAFELAMADLRDAFDCAAPHQMTTQILGVRDRLAELRAHTDNRQDAAIYAAALDAVLAFGGPDTPGQVQAAATAFHTSFHRYRAWRHRTYTPAWYGPRHQEITAWAELTTILDAAATYLDDRDPWFDSTQVLHALLRAYTASRTLSAQQSGKGPAAVTEIFIPPAIEASFLRRQHRRDTLDWALAHIPEFRDNPAAQMLHTSLRQTPPTESAPADPGSDNPPSGGDDLGKAQRWPRVADTLGPDELRLFIEAGTDRSLDTIELALRTQRDVEASISDPKLSSLMQTLLDDLSKSEDWVPGIADPFRVLLDLTVRYASYCYDIGRQMGGSYTEFLRGRDVAGKKQKVDERLFHQHYLECLNFSTLGRVTQAEVINIGGGRADILVSFGAVRFPVECKIEEENSSKDNLRAYAGQVAQYTGTNTAFGILLVLDLTGHEEGTADLFSSIWTEPIRRRHETQDRLIVTVRVPGGRTDPSATRTPLA